MTALAIKAADNHDFPHNTADPVNMQAVYEQILTTGSDRMHLRFVYGHAAEIISNIYQHAVTQAKPVVEWTFDCQKVGQHLLLTFEDDGCGVFESLHSKYGSSLTPTEALFQRHRTQTANRGRGLADIFKDYASGKLSAVLLESPSGRAELGETSLLAPRARTRFGTYIAFAMPIRDEQA